MCEAIYWEVWQVHFTCCHCWDMSWNNGTNIWSWNMWKRKLFLLWDREHPSKFVTTCFVALIRSHKGVFSDTRHCLFFLSWHPTLGPNWSTSDIPKSAWHSTLYFHWADCITAPCSNPALSIYQYLKSRHSNSTQIWTRHSTFLPPFMGPLI